MGRKLAHAALGQLSHFIAATVRPNAYLRDLRDIRAVFWHGIGDNGSPCMRHLGDEVERDVFARQLDYLQARYRILSLADAIASQDAPPAAKPVCTLSFDDGLASVHSQALPLLRERGLPATLFVNTATLDNRDLLWQHAMSYAIERHGLEAVRRAFVAAGRVSGLELAPREPTPRALLLWCRAEFDQLHRHGLIGRTLEKLGEDGSVIASQQRLYLSRAQLQDLEASGVAVCSHTHSHYPLDRLRDADSIDQEFTSAIVTLAEAGFNDAHFVSFPFGMPVDYGERGLAAAFRSGHKMAVEVGEGLNNPQRLQARRLIARVELSSVGAKASELQSALEVRPLIKAGLKRVFRRT